MISRTRKGKNSNIVKIYNVKNLNINLDQQKEEKEKNCIQLP